MARLIITFNNLKIAITLGMLVIILCDIRFTAGITVPFVLALFIAVAPNPLVQHMVHWRMPRALTVSILMTIIVMAIVLLLTYLGSALNELIRTLPQCHNSIMTSLQATEPLLQHVEIDVSVDQLAHYIDPSAAMTLLTNLLTQLPSAISPMFLLLLTILFILLEMLQLPEKLQQVMARPVEGMAAIQRVIDSVSHYLTLKTAIGIIIGLAAWAVLAALDVRFAFVWGLLASALNYTPNIGSVLAATPPVAQVLVSNNLYEALLVLAGYPLINPVFSNILGPHIMGCGSGFSTLMVFLSLIFQGRLLGPADMLLFVPLTIIVKIAFE